MKSLISAKELSDLGYVFFRDRIDERGNFREFYLRGSSSSEMTLRCYLESTRIIIYKWQHHIDESSYMDKKFDGDCPDVVTLMYIHKLLNI